MFPLNSAFVYKYSHFVPAKIPQAIMNPRPTMCLRNRESGLNLEVSYQTADLYGLAFDVPAINGTWIACCVTRAGSAHCSEIGSPTSTNPYEEDWAPY